MINDVETAVKVIGVLLGTLIAVLVICSVQLAQIAKNTRRPVATLEIRGMAGAGGAAGKSTGETVRVTPGPHLVPKDVNHPMPTTRAVHDAQTKVATAEAALSDARNHLSRAEAKASMSREETAFERAKAQANREDERERRAYEKAAREAAPLSAFDARPKSTENTPEENAEVSFKVANIAANKVLESRIGLSETIKTHPFEPAHSDALVVLHNAIGVAHREFKNAVKA
jgi:hypothetical protein